MQRQPDPDAERAKIAADAEAQLCSTDQIEAQSDAEDKLKLKFKRRREKEYAWEVGGKDSARVRKRAALSPEHQQEIIVKIRFFEGDAKPAYLRTIMSALTQYADSEQVLGIVNAPPCATPTVEPTAESGEGGGGNPCDIGKLEYRLIDENEPAKSRCMNIKTDPEFDKHFDFNIVNAVGHAVPGTTWENVEYDRFQVMQVFYRNGISEYFMLNALGDFHVGQAPFGMTEPVFVKRATGLIYPVRNGRLDFNEVFTPNILRLKNGLKSQTRELKDLYNLLQVGGSFAAILGMYGLGVESFKASVYAFRRGGPVRLPGRPLPGIGVKAPVTPEAHIQSVFADLGGPRRGYKIQLVDDSTVIDTPGGGFSKAGLAAKNAGGAETNIVTKQIFVHQDVFNANGVVRRWGATLDLKQVIAHELGHGVNNGGPCALASRAGADLPGLSAAQRMGLLDDAVHISRSAPTADERVSLQQLNLPTGYTPPKR